MAIDLPAPGDNPGGAPGPAPHDSPYATFDSEPITSGNSETSQRPDPRSLIGAMAILHAARQQQQRLRRLRIIGLVVCCLALFGIYGLLMFFGLAPTLIDY